MKRHIGYLKQSGEGQLTYTPVIGDALRLSSLWLHLFLL